LRLITKPGEQLFDLVAAAMHVADEVEWTVIVLPVISQRRPLDRDRFDFLWRFQDDDVAKSFTFQRSERPSQLGSLLPNDVSAELTVSPLAIALLAYLFGQVENNSNRGGRIEADQLFVTVRPCCRFSAPRVPRRLLTRQRCVVQPDSNLLHARQAVES
jgi:hypothetical protein